MNEKTSNWLDFSLKVIIALVVPITIAIIGLSGEMIISKAGENQQKLEIITRQAEAHTAFQRDLFSEPDCRERKPLELLRESSMVQLEAMD